MEPRIVLIAEYPGKTDAQVWEVLRNIGVWVLRREDNAVWQLREQLQVAHAILVVMDRPSGPNDKMNTSFELEIVELLKYYRQHSLPQVMTIVQDDALTQHPLKLVTDLRGFPSVEFYNVLTPPDLRQIVEFVFNAARPMVDTTKLDGDILIAKGKIELNRLRLIAEESDVLTIWPILAVIVTLAGLAFSIPVVLTRLGLSDYWLFIGPVVFIAGSLTTMYVIRRRTRRHRLKKIAAQLKEDLSEVLTQLERNYRLKGPLSETQTPTLPT